MKQSKMSGGFLLHCVAASAVIAGLSMWVQNGYVTTIDMFIAVGLGAVIELIIWWKSRC